MENGIIWDGGILIDGVKIGGAISLKKYEVDMLSGSISRGLISMAIPIMIMNVVQMLFGIIDMTVLGKFANDTAVGAVGACSTLISLFTGLLIGVATGANVVVAKYIGKGDRNRVEQAVGTALLFSVVGGLVLAVIGVSCAEIFLKWTYCPPSILESAVLYFRVYFIGVPILMFYNFCASILRAAGDTKRPMLFLMMSGVIKIVLTLIFVTVFNMTVDGVAIATIISTGIAAALAFAVLLRSKDRVHFDFKKFKFYKDELKEMLFIGVPAGLQSALYSFANTIIVTTVNSFGPNATTGLSIANQFDGVLYYVSCATALATSPYIAQNIGAGNIKRAKKTVGRAMLITTAFGASLGALSAIFSGQLSSLMSSTPEVIEFSKQKMVIISSTYFICGINEVMGGTLRGMGKPIIPTISTLVFMCLIRFVWVYGIFPFCPSNLTFLYLIWPIGWILSIVTLLIAFFPTMAKLKKKAEEEKVTTL